MGLASFNKARRLAAEKKAKEAKKEKKQNKKR